MACTSNLCRSWVGNTAILAWFQSRSWAVDFCTGSLRSRGGCKKSRGYMDLNNSLSHLGRGRELSGPLEVSCWFEASGPLPAQPAQVGEGSSILVGVDHFS